MQLTTQPGSCSPPPGTYRSGAIISLLLCRCSSVRLRNTRLLSIWTGANEAVGNMKLFNNHSGLRGLPCLAEGIYWATGLSRTTPFTEGRLGVNNKASPPGRHQEQAPKQRCTFRPTTFSSVQGQPLCGCGATLPGGQDRWPESARPSTITCKTSTKPD